jgi:tripartite-type tricarboxylate transporter receptor subunit TctC
MLKMVKIWSALALLLTAAVGAEADEFYRGKTLKIIVGSAAGTSYDSFARTLARTYPKHIAGSPTIIVQNMPGAAGITATNHLYNLAEKDGTVIGLLNRYTIVQSVIGNDRARYKSEKFYWLGTPATFEDDPYIFMLRSSVPFKSAQEVRTAAKPINVGNSGSAPVKILKDALGFNVKIIEGYEKNQVDAAFERGEIEAMGIGYQNLLSRRPQWLKEKFVTPIVQFGSEERSPIFPDVPTALELAETAEGRALIGFIEAPLSIAYPFAAPPTAPEERSIELRKAFAAAMADPTYKREIEKQKLAYSPKTGEAVERTVMSLVKAPAAAIERYREVVGLGGE